MKKSRLTFFVLGSVMLVLFIAVLWLVFKPEVEELTIGSGCNDYVMPRADEIGCTYLINQRVEEIKDKGYEPNDCSYKRSEAVDCPGLGQALVCTFECGP